MIQQTQEILLKIQAHTPKDTLINSQEENLIKIGVIIMIVVSSIVLRTISPKVEYAVIFALVSSLIAITFFMFY